jgi:hypothetical protein
MHQTYHGALGSHGLHMGSSNKIYQENTNQQVARYNTEALDRIYEEIWGKHAGLVERLRAFQTKHFENRQSIENLNYESKLFWANLADQCIVEEALPIRTEMYTLSEFFGARLGVGCTGHVPAL